MSDEGFHEIQLNGKQLVFLFMAATVVSVVIFLCGVMVGRGVRMQQGTAVATELGPSAPVDEPVASQPPAGPAQSTSAPPPAPAAQQTSPGGAPPPDPQEDADADYYKALTQDESAKEPKVEAPAAAAPARETRAETPATVAVPKADKPAPPPMPASAPAAVTGSGFVVQIAALKDRGEADAIAKRLAVKGYQAFVVNPPPGKAVVYKVQVGRFTERGEAERIASRLKSEEQFSPWVTR